MVFPYASTTTCKLFREENILFLAVPAQEVEIYFPTLHELADVYLLVILAQSV